ncbi:hypothetical protein SAMN04488047_101719, partial [Tranquillimonas alkanivorans]
CRTERPDRGPRSITRQRGQKLLAKRTATTEALYAHHGDRYLHTGRWLLAGAALVGWGAGLALEIPNLWLAGTFALLAGSVVLNVIKEELPEERESRFWAFALGTAGYAALLLAITVQEGGGTA